MNDLNTTGSKGRVFLRASDLSYSFFEAGTPNEVLKGVSLEIRKGEVTAIVGPSGCGKSTLLYLLGLLDRPGSGSIFLNETEVSSASDHVRTDFRNKQIGFVFQFHFLIKELSALENVALPIRKSGLGKKDSYEKAFSALSKLGLADKADRFANKLSGGEQQRVAIARAIANSPSLILADEPTGNLDSENSEKVFSILDQLAIREDLGVLIVTHNRELAGKCSNLIQMKDGLILNSSS